MHQQSSRKTVVLCSEAGEDKTQRASDFREMLRNQVPCLRPSEDGGKGEKHQELSPKPFNSELSLDTCILNPFVLDLQVKNTAIFPLLQRNSF